MSPATAVAVARLSDLTGALDREAAAAEELVRALLTQRGAVAANRPEEVNATVDAIGRILLTLSEARERRAALTAEIAGDRLAPIDRLVETLGVPLTNEFVEARVRLRRAAEDVSREATINRGVLQRTLHAGEAWLQALFSTAIEPTPGYRADEKPEAKPPGVLLDRKA
jgi:hypothetical protein